MAHSEAAEVAANVRAEMARAGLSARTLAQQMAERYGEHGGIAARTLSRRLQGGGAFRVDELTRIATVLDVPLSTLLPTVAA